MPADFNPDKVIWTLKSLNDLVPKDHHFHVAYFNPERRQWVLPDGEFNIYYPILKAAEEAAKADGKSGRAYLNITTTLRVSPATVRVVRCNSADCR